MSRSEELCMTYTVSRLSETAKTFRRLGEAYESASGEEAQSPCFKHQLFLVADILDDCTLMQMQADKPSKSVQGYVIKGAYIGDSYQGSKCA